MQICDPVLRYRKSGFLYNGRIFRGKAYGLTEEETEKLAELVKEKVKTQYLDKYEIDPASFTFPEYEPIAERTEAKDLWTPLDWNYLRSYEVATIVVVAEEAGYKDKGMSNSGSVEKNMALLNEIIPLVESMKYENIGCRIQYDAVLDKEKIEREAKEICEKLTGKFITYCGIEGKIKVVDEVNNYKTYGFFRKGARRKYYKVSNTEIIAMKLQEAI